MFGLVVTAYVVSVIGIPVFLHYCGGEIENVNFVVKGSTACCGEEEDAEPMDDGCCKDENLVVKNNPNFTFQKNTNNDLVKSFCQLFYISLPLKNETFTPALNLEYLSIEAPPPKLQASLIISTSVLRI